MPNIPLWNDEITVLREAQVLLAKVSRWDRFTDVGVRTRPQTVLAHSFEAPLTSRILLGRLTPHLPSDLKLDMDLLHTAHLVHDIAEGYTCQKHDKSWKDKDEADDVREYEAYSIRFNVFPEPLHTHFDRAFLLQFTHKKDLSAFPEHAQRQMLWLMISRPWENRLFRAGETWGYMLFAAEQYRDLDNAEVLTNVLFDLLPTNDRLAREFPGYNIEVWTPATRVWAVAFIKAHADLLLKPGDRERALAL